jgi:hypothetical protein
VERHRAGAGGESAAASARAINAVASARAVHAAAVAAAGTSTGAGSTAAATGGPAKARRESIIRQLDDAVAQAPRPRAGAALALLRLLGLDKANLVQGRWMSMIDAVCCGEYRRLRVWTSAALQRHACAQNTKRM